MKLYLMQHGDALSKEQDPERPLSPAGEAAVRAMAELLRGKLHPVRILHSGKLRARQSAELLARAVPGVAPQAVEGLAPNDDTAAFAAQIAQWDEEVVLVGHLPFMARLATRLLGADEAGPLVAYQTGSVLCLQRTEGVWQVAWMVRPELL